jgi:hypothetical protein
MKSCVIVPTRGRPENMARLAESFVGTNAQADLYAVIDKDDPKFDKYLDNKDYMCLVSDNQTGGAAKAFNDGAQLLLDSSVFPFYDIFIFFGDDCLPQTLNWDQSLQKALLGKTGVAYGNDLLQGENLPTHFAVTRDIVERMQGIVPPGIKHLYMDNFVKQLGLDLDCLIYLPEVVLEHLHPVANKAEWDEGYKRVNQESLYTEDLLAMQIYLRSSEYADLVNALK